jgi:hypothetical protein
MLSSMVGSGGEVIATILLPFGSSLRVSIYRRRVESACVSFGGFTMVQP